MINEKYLWNTMGLRLCGLSLLPIEVLRICRFIAEVCDRCADRTRNWPTRDVFDSVYLR